MRGPSSEKETGVPNSLEMIDEAWERFRREPERLETYLAEL